MINDNENPWYDIVETSKFCQVLIYKSGYLSGFGNSKYDALNSLVCELKFCDYKDFKVYSGNCLTCSTKQLWIDFSNNGVTYGCKLFRKKKNDVNVIFISMKR